MRMIHLITSIAFMVATCQLSFANNTYFLPGDAFFYARLNLESSQKLGDLESPILTYGDHWNAGTGGGHIGYQSIKLIKMPDGTKAAMVDAYRQFQNEISGDPTLGGKMSVFIYSIEYDWRKFGLGLQYNENWVAESVAFGAPRDHVRLESFVKYPSSLMQSWRDSDLVAPLLTKNPALPAGHQQAWTKTPVTIDCSKCRILIIPNRNFDSYVTPANRSSLIEISNGVLARYTRTNGKWESK